MSGVGGVGAVGASGGVGAVGATGGTGSVGSGASPGVGDASGGGSSPTEGVTSSSNEGTSSKEVSDSGDKFGSTYNINQVQNNTIYQNMSTEQSLELHNCVHGVGESSSCNEMDLQKLIELMMAIKILEAMNDSQGGSSGGFSTTA